MVAHPGIFLFWFAVTTLIGEGVAYSSVEMQLAYSTATPADLGLDYYHKL